jgi:hypothetical protein
MRLPRGAPRRGASARRAARARDRRRVGAPHGAGRREPEVSRSSASRMGDLVLKPPPCIARGRVRDRAGEPVKGVTVTIATPTGSSSTGTPAAWTPSQIKGRTDVQGEFVLRGRVDASRIRLQLYDWRCRAEPVEAEPGGERRRARRVAATRHRAPRRPRPSSIRRRLQMRCRSGRTGTRPVSPRTTVRGRGHLPHRSRGRLPLRGSAARLLHDPLLDLGREALAALPDVLVESGKLTRDARCRLSICAAGCTSSPSISFRPRRSTD